ncbi:MAG: Lar family restriction alleviation protein [Candidatus Thiodiazotropha lotti]|nr:Lar family restriction alleviation protein [Candidatus Thiodiazotropha lotti]MCW4221796.1 Lar family restriction alleviation protein [Candidatus Thiodiazotropha lotti]
MSHKTYFKKIGGPDDFETNAPCPWCGSRKVIFATYLNDAWIQCDNNDCESQGPSVTYSGHAEESARLQAMKKWAKTDDIEVT